MVGAGPSNQSCDRYSLLARSYRALGTMAQADSRLKLNIKGPIH